MAFGNIFVGENVQSFKSSPKFDNIDMVILNIDENAYVSSPYVRIDEDTWEKSSIGKRNGKYVFEYDPGTASWKRSGSAVSLENFGITAVFNVLSMGAKAGDKITVNRMGETKSEDIPDPKIQIEIELTRSGRTMEANCPLCKPAERQAIADSLLEKLSGYGYQPFTATGAEVNPLAELGDGITTHGIYSGLYQQDLNFNQLMNSDIGAPADEELDHEYTYQTASERKYSRKFADVSAEFEIHWNAILARVTSEQYEADLEILNGEISARVTREGTGEGFSWSLIESAFSVSAGNKVVFRVDKDGTYTEGSGIFSGAIQGGTIQIGEKFSVDANGNMKATDAEMTGAIKGGTIKIGDNFSVDASGNMKATNAEMTGAIKGGTIKIGDNFSVDASGNMKATNAEMTGAIKGGTIKIGSNFSVDESGNMKASNAELTGAIKGGTINIGTNFSVDATGTLKASNVEITGAMKGGTINIGSNFSVDTSGKMKASGAEFSGAISGGTITIGENFSVNSTGKMKASGAEFSGSITGGTIKIGDNFSVDSSGNMTASGARITGAVNGGTISIGSGFSVDKDGNMRAVNATLTGTLSVGGTNIDASTLRYGAQTAYDNGSNWTTAYTSTSSGGYCYTGSGYGYNFNSMTTQSYTANWVVANHIMCYSDGNISGHHYGGWYDGYEYNAVYWESVSVPTSVSSSCSWTYGYYFKDTSDTTRYLLSGLSVSTGFGSYNTIDYLGH